MYLVLNCMVGFTLLPYLLECQSARVGVEGLDCQIPSLTSSPLNSVTQSINVYGEPLIPDTLQGTGE